MKVMMMMMMMMVMAEMQGRRNRGSRVGGCSPNFWGKVYRCDKLTVMIIYRWKSPAFACFCFVPN